MRLSNHLFLISNKLNQRQGHVSLPALVLGWSMIFCVGSAANAQAILGEIYLVPYNFSPKGFADCNGQLLPISQNTALFSLLGTTYGGDGKSTFALPDLRDRVPVGAGQGPGRSDYIEGQSGGEYAHTLTIGEMPSHTHTVTVDTGQAVSASPLGNVPGRNAAGVPTYAGSANAPGSEVAVGMTGGGAPHNNLQPFLGLKYIIALQGVYPTRN